VSTTISWGGFRWAGRSAAKSRSCAKRRACARARAPLKGYELARRIDIPPPSTPHTGGTYSACRQAVDDFRAKHKIDEPIVDIDGSGAFRRRTAEPAVGGVRDRFTALRSYVRRSRLAMESGSSGQPRRHHAAHAGLCRTSC